MCNRPSIPLNGTVLIFSSAQAYRSVATVGETHSAGAVCSSQLNYFNQTRKRLTSRFLARSQVDLARFTRSARKARNCKIPSENFKSMLRLKFCNVLQLQAYNRGLLFVAPCKSNAHRKFLSCRKFFFFQENCLSPEMLKLNLETATARLRENRQN